MEVSIYRRATCDPKVREDIIESDSAEVAYNSKMMRVKTGAKYPRHLSVTIRPFSSLKRCPMAERRSANTPPCFQLLSSIYFMKSSAFRELTLREGSGECREAMSGEELGLEDGEDNSNGWSSNVSDNGSFRSV